MCACVWWVWWVRYALKSGASFQAVDMDSEEQLYRSEHWLDKEKEKKKKKQEEDKKEEEQVYNLFAFPGECNFSGVKHTLEWVNRYQSNGPRRASKG